MKLWKNPRLAAALCAVVVLVCAAAPAVFLSVVDAASLGHSQAVADPYTAPTPTADDYYLLRQLSARQLTQSKYTFQPGDTGQERKPLIYYNNQANDLTDMTNGWDYVDTVNTALQSLADAGAISQAWADYAADWYSTEETTLTTYDERQYSLTVPYYSVDSLGLVTFKRFAVQNGVPTTLMTLKMDSRTGQVYSFWLSTPADSAAAPGVSAQGSRLARLCRPGRADQSGGLDPAGGPDLPPGHLQPERTGAGGRCVGHLHRQ